MVKSGRPFNGYPPFPQDSIFEQNTANNISFLKSFLGESVYSQIKLDYPQRVYQNQIGNYVFNDIFLSTHSKYIRFGKGFGIDLWFLEASLGPFLMLHDTSLDIKVCESATGDYDSEGTSKYFIPTGCNLKLEKVKNYLSKSYTGFAAGTVTEFSIVFLETDNWRISMDHSITSFNFYLDNNFEQVSISELALYPEFKSSNTVYCDRAKYQKLEDNSWADTNCKNSRGEDHQVSNDYTHGLKISYYFR